MLAVGRGRIMTTTTRQLTARSTTTNDKVLRLQSLSTLPKWPKSVVTSNGDYREEAWLEKEIGGLLYQVQESLPRLPVPTIADTLQRFLPTALPLARNEPEATALQAAVQAFERQAAPLQARLEQRAAANPDSSWLQHWWNTLGYLQVRDPITINVTYFFQLADDPSAETSVDRAAALAAAGARYRRQVITGELPAERIGKAKTPLCSTAFKYMFNACRIPQREQDCYEMHDPSLHNHMIVARKGHFFSVSLTDPQTQLPLSAATLKQGLQQCVEMADSMADAYPELGWMTSCNRDDWADMRAQLLQQGGPAMEQALQVLQSGAFMICLDDETPISAQEAGLWSWHGNLTSGGNRWFDKSIQILVSNGGKAAMNGEHSMMDGMPLVGFADMLTKASWSEESAGAAGAQGGCEVEPIFQEAFDSMNTSVLEPLENKAKSDFTDLITKHELHVQRFQGYGSDFAKQAGFSPDAFVQMALQVATYRLWGEQGGTYEATQVRPFLHGRTETTRSVSAQSAAFIRAMGFRPDGGQNIAEKLQLLQEAVQAHVKYISAAAKAQGVDRHFLGLSMLVQDGEDAPDLYADPVFARSKRWRVSTSHLTHPKFDNWGYGEVVPDGVGLAYSIHKRHCVFNLTALKEHGWTDKLSLLIEEALLEMRSLVEASGSGNGSPKSKL